MTLRDDLIAARALIDTPRKWRKNGQLGGGRMCAVNAVIEAVGATNTWPCDEALSAALGVVSSPVLRADIADFNDDPETTHADVMALFDRAIARAS